MLAEPKTVGKKGSVSQNGDGKVKVEVEMAIEWR
jgi:hypothetical protein